MPTETLNTTPGPIMSALARAEQAAASIERVMESMDARLTPVLNPPSVPIPPVPTDMKPGPDMLVRLTALAFRIERAKSYAEQIAARSAL